MIDFERLWEAVEITGMIVLLAFIFVLALWLLSRLGKETPLWQDFLAISILISSLIIVIYNVLGA